MYSRFQTVGAIFSVIFFFFQSYGFKDMSTEVVFRVEFDGDIRFFLDLQKSMFLLICIDFFDVFAIFSFSKFLQKS